MSLWTKLLGLAAAFGAVLAAFFRARGKQHAAEAREQTNRAEQAESAVKTHQRVNERLRATQARHREEDKDAEENRRAGRRDHLDDSW